MSTGVLLTMPVLVAVNGDGEPISGARLQFYLTGTTTPTPTYTSAALSTPNANPVVANGAGQFPAIYLDPTVTYRVQLQTATGGVLADIDPANLDVVAATQAQVNAGSATGVYVSPATLAAWTGVAAALGYTPVNKAGDMATNLAINPATPAVNSAGYLGAPGNNPKTRPTRWSCQTPAKRSSPAVRRPTPGRSRSTPRWPFRCGRSSPSSTSARPT